MDQLRSIFCVQNDQIRSILENFALEIISVQGISSLYTCMLCISIVTCSVVLVCDKTSTISYSMFFKAILKFLYSENLVFSLEILVFSLKF